MERRLGMVDSGVDGYYCRPAVCALRRTNIEIAMSHHFVRFNDVTVRYPGSDRNAVDGVSLLITHGEHVALLGLNGAGKSTLMLTINGLLMPTSGDVNVGDVPVTKKTFPIVRQSVGMVFQNADDQLFMPTVEDDVAFGPRNMGLPETEVERRVNAALEAVGCRDLRRRAPFQLSGGQKRMCAIATVLSMEPAILVLDEPSANLDARSRRQLIDVLRRFSHTMILATHDVEMAAELCERAVLLSDGRVAADAPLMNVLEHSDMLDLSPSRLSYLHEIISDRNRQKDTHAG